VIKKHIKMTITSPQPEPHVFISYSWDSDEHKDWIRDLADRLLADGVGVTLDQYDLRGGQDKHLFMEEGVRNATHVIIACTPAYVERANERVRGVGVETSLITGKFYDREKTKKEFIPVLCSGSVTPDYLGSIVYVSFEDTSKFEQSYNELRRLIHQAPEYVKPAKGNKPSLEPKGSTPQVDQNSIESIKKRVIDSNPDDWEYNDERGVFTFKSDATLQLRQLDADNFDKFEESWVGRYPDPVAYRDRYEVLFHGNFIEEFFFVGVDGLRMSIPLPKSSNDLRISQQQYRLGKIINSKMKGYDFDDYLNRADIIIDESL
jgi:hypothetical protein